MNFNRDDLDQLAKLMEIRGLTEMDLFDTETGQHIHLKRSALGRLYQSSLARGSPPEPVVEPLHEAGPEDIQPLDVPCACGHMIEIEHSTGGCLHGCDVRVCGNTR